MKKQSSENQKDHKPNFEGSNPLLKGYYYTYNPEQSAVDQYAATTEKLIEVMCQSLKESQMVKTCLKTLKKETLPEPQLEQNGTIKDTEGATTKVSTRQDELKYTTLIKSWEQRKNSLDESLSQTFSTIYGQCNRAMKAKIQEDKQWVTVDTNCDAVGLLKIIKSIAHNNETQKNPVISLIQAEKRLLNMTQGDNQSNDSYRLKFENQASVIKNMGGTTVPRLHTRNRLKRKALQEVQRPDD